MTTRSTVTLTLRSEEDTAAVTLSVPLPHLDPLPLHLDTPPLQLDAHPLPLDTPPLQLNPQPFPLDTAPPVGSSALPVGHSVAPVGRSAPPVGHSATPVEPSALPVGHSATPVGHSSSTVPSAYDILALKADLFDEDLYRLVMYESSLYKQEVIRADVNIDVSSVTYCVHEANNSASRTPLSVTY